MLTNGLFHLITSFSSHGDTLGWDGAQVDVLKQAPGRSHWPPAERENRKFKVVSTGMTRDLLCNTRNVLLKHFPNYVFA